ncbi:MAG: 30S ribosomal protein S15 [Elusimicrobia bacterium HGW-Elusimicrobia-1]|jgi:small subunit ribosomal protein S15|nr:MAG: 30S ribosomal protein S15 [Elusimicrobia bacterium HGW-Elusimicrobia-1]
MPVSKAPIIEKFKVHPTDTGSSAVQIGIITERINLLNEHFKKFPKDLCSRHGFLRLIGRRRRLLEYLKRIDFARYKEVIASLNLRK